MERKEHFSSMNASEYLEKMEHMEKEGTRFMNVRMKDRKHKLFAPLMMSLLMIVLMVSVSVLFVWMYIANPVDRPPIFFVVLMTAISLLVILGVLWNLWKRYQEIEGGEEDAASKY